MNQTSSAKNSISDDIHIGVGKEENSIRRLIEMNLIEKRFIDNRSLYVCQWHDCSYSTIRSDSIVRHSRSHTGERPYKCHLCDYSTIQSSSLKKHMARHLNT
ncbi:zinc finger protein Klf1 [Dermatophagoides farinae]|nr:zinc finger protein Klf1 [Dermatophagoides farinae]